MKQYEGKIKLLTDTPFGYTLSMIGGKWRLVILVVGSQGTITDIGTKSLVFLFLSGLATGGSWLCYFRALQVGDVNKVVPVDKSSTILTMLFSFIFLGEGLT